MQDLFYGSLEERDALATAITNKGIETSVSDTLTVMAENVNQIRTGGLLEKGQALIFSNTHSFPQIINVSTGVGFSVSGGFYGITIIRNNGWTNVASSYQSIIGYYQNGNINTSTGSLVTSRVIPVDAEYIFLHTTSGNQGFGTTITVN